MDVDHPDLAGDVKERWGIDPETLRDPVPSAAPKGDMPEAPSFEEPIDGVLDLTLRQITTRFASVQGFDDWLDRRKAVADISRLESRNARDAGRIIAREPVRTHIIGYLESLSQNMLRSAAVSIAARTAALAKTGAPHEEIVTLVRSILSAELKASKRRVTSMLRSPVMAAGDNPPPVQAPAETKDDVGIHAVWAFAAMLRPEFRAASKTIATKTIQTVGRLAGGDRFDAPTFDRVKAALEPTETEIAKTIAAILGGHLDNAVTNYMHEDRHESTDED